VKTERAFPIWVNWVSLAAIAVGVAAWAMGLSASETHARAAVALLVNALFWGGLAQALVVWAATFQLCRTRWSHAVEYLGAAGMDSVLLLLLPWAGVCLLLPALLPWLGQDMGDRAIWLSGKAVLLRTGFGLALMAVLTIAFARQQWAHGTAASPRRDRSVLAVALTMAFTGVWSLIAFDFVMSLAQPWYSTLIGAYFFTGSLYAGMAALILLAIGLRGRIGMAAHLGSQQWLDLGNLMMAFGMASTYMLFSQLLVIWYGNMPHETSFLRLRLDAPWFVLSWVILIAAYLGPFLLLLPNFVRRDPRPLGASAVVVLGAMWLERYWEVAPSLLPGGVQIGPLEVLTTVGFAGLFLLGIGRFVVHYPFAAAEQGGEGQ
jgi:hypothetical protein